MLDLNRCTEIQYPLFRHFFNFSSTAVKRYSTFQWILVPLSFNTSSITKSHRANRCYTDAFIVLALNQSTEIQYPLFRHFFNFSSTAVKRQSTFQGILVPLSFNTSSITKSHRANRCYTYAFIVLDLNRSTEIQYPLFRHFFNFSTAAEKRQSTFQGIIVLLSFNTSNIMKSHRAYKCYTDAFIVLDLNRSTEIQYPLFRHFFNFSSAAVKRQSTFQGILVPLSFNTSSITKSHRANRCYTDAFIVLDLNRSTEIQYPLFRHFFNFSTAAEKRQSTFQGILVLLSFNTSNIMKSHRAYKCYTNAFIVLALNRSTEIQYHLFRHFFNFSSAAVKRQSTFQGILVPLSFNTSSITKSHRANRCYTDAFIVLDLNRSTEIQYPLFRHFFNFSTAAEKRQSTFQWILVPLSFNTSSITKSHRANRGYTDAFIMLDLNRCTEIQYPHFRHFFIFSSTAVKRQYTFQGILVLLSFNTSNIMKSHRAFKCYTDAFIVLALNRSTEIQYPLIRHFFNFSTAAEKRLSTFQWILVPLSFNTSSIMKSHRAYKCYTDAFIVLDLNRSTEIQYPLFMHFFNFSSTAVKRQSTFQGILVPLSFNTSSITKSHRANRCYTDAFIVLDLNRSTEIQYSLFRHFFNQSTAAVKRQSTYQWILVPLSFNTSSITKSHRANRGITDAFIMLDLNRCTEIQYPLFRHFFNFSTAAVKRQSTFQWILVPLSFNTSSITKSHRAYKYYIIAFIVLDLNRSTEIKYPRFRHFFNFSSTAVKRQSTFQGILVPLSFNTSNITKSHRANRCYTNAFIVLDLNRSTEIQYPLFRHFFNFSTAAEKRQSTFQGIIVLLSFNTSNIMKSHRAYKCYTDAFIVQNLNRSTEIQYPLFRHFFNFSSAAVKRQSTFQGILVPLSFNTSSITKSHRANRCYTDAFIVLDLNRSTEIQYPLFRHFFNFSTAAEKRQSTFQGILVLLSFNTSNIMKSHRAYKCYTNAFIVLALNRSTEIQYHLFRHFFNFSSAAVKRQSTFQGILVPLSFNTSSITKSHRANRCYTDAFIVLDLNRSTEIQYPLFRHFFNFSTAAEKRQSTFQWILVPLSFNTSSITKSHRANRGYTDAFIMLDLNRCTEIQYPHFRHFFIFSSTAVKRQYTFQGILVLLSFNTSNIMKSHRAFKCYTDAFIVLALNRSTEIQYPLIRHFFNFSTAAEKRLSTFQWILVPLSFNTSSIMKSHRAYKCYTDAFIVLDLNRSTEIQYPLFMHFFNFSSTAVKRQSTFQGILVPLSFNTSSITKSHRANRCYTDAFIVLDLNRSTEIQYSLFRHFFNQSTAAVKRQSTYQWILVPLSFNTSSITKSHRANRGITDAFIMLDLNRCTEIQYPLFRHFFNFSTAAVKRQSTFQWILVPLSFNTSSITKSHRAYKYYIIAFIVLDLNRSTEIKYPRFRHFFNFSSTAVKRQSTFQGILVPLSFNTSNITKSHRANRCYTNAFIVLDLNRSTEIQYPLFRHFFNFSTAAEKRQSTFQGILVLLSFNTSNIMKSHRAYKCYTNAFIVLALNRSTEIQYHLFRHFFNFSSAAVKRQSTFQGILVPLSFNTSSITKSHRANRCYTDAFIVLDLNRSTEIQYPLFRHFFNFSTAAEKRQSTFQWILVPLSFNTSSITKSHRANRGYTDAFIMLDLNRCTEIQYPHFRHFFIFSSTAVKRQYTFQGILVLLSFNTSNIMKSHRAFKCYTDAFIVLALNRSTEIQYPLIRHFFNFSTAAEKRLSTFQWILVPLSFNTSSIMKSHRAYKCYTDAFIVLDLNRSTEIQYPLFMHFFNFSSTAVKRQSTFQGILVPLSFNTSSITKSHRANRCYTDAFIVLDLNRSTEIQYSLFRHFFNQSTAAVKRQSTYQWILVPLSFNTSSITKSHRANRGITDAFIMLDLNRCTEIQYPLFRHFFNFSTAAVKRQSTFQWILVPLSFNTSSITKSHRANRCYTDAFIVLALNQSTEIQYPLFRHFFNFRTTAVKRQSTIHWIIEQLLFNTSSITKSHQANRCYTDAFIVLDLNRSIEIQYPHFRHFFNFSSTAVIRQSTFQGILVPLSFNTSSITKSHRANRGYTDAFIVLALNRCTEFQYPLFRYLFTFRTKTVKRQSTFQGILVPLSFNTSSITKSHRVKRGLYRYFHCASLESKY